MPSEMTSSALMRFNFAPLLCKREGQSRRCNFADVELKREASSKEKLVEIVYCLQVEVGDSIRQKEEKVQAEVKLTAVSDVRQGQGQQKAFTRPTMNQGSLKLRSWLLCLKSTHCRAQDRKQLLFL